MFGAALGIAGLGCHEGIFVPPSQVSRLVSTPGRDIELMDDAGEVVVIRPADIDSVRLVPAAGRRLMVIRHADALRRGVNVVSLDDDTAAAWEARGYESVRTLEEPVTLRLQGNVLQATDADRTYGVALRDLDTVRLDQPLEGPNWKAVGWVAVGLAVAVPVVTGIVWVSQMPPAR